ncbi:hypothetical protein BD324DRAFT_614018 [Kockovaella imperatae]|uniref:choline-phosphate cytidylyltransferase n=1 Tax=Kockovaella imperatae TaxID=4999 RepID=A0A1Y1UUJ3_9TREE|nr:hypothetical protein BD324DRAFT_614018 [Kockovaella imperatae]ORX41297.1 hypothetical protein BD324DRAFT_614018 [Kockovaella imperatae]
MAAVPPVANPLGPPKRHRGNRLGERRLQRDGSSRDASEEDNDEAASDVGSLMSIPAPPEGNSTTAPGTLPSSSASPRPGPPQALPIPIQLMNQGQASHSHSARRGSAPHAIARRVEEVSGEELSGLDSPTYDGDVESASTVGGTPVHHSVLSSHQYHHQRQTSSPIAGMPADAPGQSTLSPYGQKVPTPKASRVNLVDEPEYTAIGIDSFGRSPPFVPPSDVPVARSDSLAEATKSQTLPLSRKPSRSMGPPKMMTRPKELPIEDIRAFVQRAIDGKGEEDGIQRWWKTKAPEEGRVVRVYADGVYDLFHFGHALQLRQCKLSFPRVHLLVGVCSDDLCATHKSAPVMTHAERCEAIRHCRWADEVLPDAPWVVTQEWMDKHQIDYIAHDEELYPSKDYDDVYEFAKEQGAFVPTRRTPAISTSDLLERIVRGYRDGFFDSKLEKNGLSELMASDVDWDSSPSRSRAQSKEGRKRDLLEIATTHAAIEQL